MDKKLYTMPVSIPMKEISMAIRKEDITRLNYVIFFSPLSLMAVL